MKQEKFFITFFAVAVFIGAALVTVMILSSCAEADNPFLELVKIEQREAPPPPPPPPPPPELDPELPRISEHPQGAVYTVDGAAAALTVVAEVDDGGTLSYQWYRADEDLTEATDPNEANEATEIDGATEWEYTPPTAELSVVFYYAIITNTLNEKTAAAASDTARIEVVDRYVTGIEIAAQPSQLTYTHGDTLDLAGLAATLLYNDGLTEDAPFADFASRNISTNPVQYTMLSCVAYNGRTVAVSFAGLTTETAALTVNKAIPEITFPTSAALTYGPPLSDSALSGGSVEFGEFAWANGWTVPVVNQNGYPVEFTPFDTDNYDYTGLTGWNSVTGRLVRTVAITVYPAPIYDAGAVVIGPNMGSVPMPSVTGVGNFFFNGTAVWEPAGSIFLGNVAYTAVVTLWAHENYLFADQVSGRINGNAAAVSGNTGRQVTLTYTFSPTDSKSVTGLSIISVPTAPLTYTHNEPLNLSGLMVMLSYDDTSTDYVALAEFQDRNISVTPGHNAVLSCVTHDRQTVTVSYGGYSAAVGILTVNKLAGAAVTKPTVASVTATSITINAASLVTATGQSIEYAASTTDPAHENPANLSWRLSPLTFQNLIANMTYYVYARSREDATHYAGAMNSVAVPLQAFTININQITDSGINLNFTDSNGNSMDTITLYRTREPRTATITITNASGYAIEWWYETTRLTTDATLTLDVTNTLYGWPGRKYITVIATRTGYPPSSKRFELVTYN